LIKTRISFIFKILNLVTNTKILNSITNMTKRLSLFLLLFSFQFSTFAQDENEKILSKIFKVNFFAEPGLSYEIPTAKLQSLLVSAFMNSAISYKIKNGLFGPEISDFKFYFDPTLSLQYRQYINYNKRIEKQKKTELNNMSYLAFVYENIYTKVPQSKVYYGDILKRRSIHRSGIVFGIQRNSKGKNFSLDFNIGLGYKFSKSEYVCNCFDGVNYVTNITNKNESGLTFISRLGLGIRLNNK